MHGASAVFVVKDGNGTACIMADFSATFLTSYDTRSGPQVGEPAPPLRLCARDGPAAVPLGGWVSCAHWGCSPTGRREPCSCRLALSPSQISSRSCSAVTTQGFVT